MADRQAALDRLKARREGGAAALPPLNMTPTSPEFNDTGVLVPSSSPAPPARPSTSKYFAAGTSSSNGHTNGRPQFPIPSSRPSTSSVIPSSRLGAPNGGAHGSPLSVVNAINARRNEGGSSPLGPADSKDTLITPSRPPPSSDPLRLTSATPSPLVHAARQAQGSDYSGHIVRLKMQFESIRRDIIEGCLRRHSGNIEKVVRELQTMDAAIQAKKTENSSLLPSSSRNHPAHHTPNPQVQKVPKPKKNESSRIYANRDSTAGKRRSKDSESEAEDGGQSEAESEMDWSGDEGRKKKKRKGNEEELDAEGAALKAFNEVEADVLTGTIACSLDQANKIISLRPFNDVDDVYTKLNKARGVSFKLFEQYTEIMEGYVQIDACLNKCARIARDVSETLTVWRGAGMTNDSVIGTPRSDGLNDVKVDVKMVTELLRKETDTHKKDILSKYIQTQPSNLKEGTVLKDYQLLGVNWLNLLFSKKIGCILADEMGLGKTIQVIAFLAHLKEKGNHGPHMIYVPASTLENWIREFEKFCPEIDVQTYYGSQSERAALRDDIKRRFRAGTLEVVLASYTQVAAADDLHFFRKKVQFETCIYDEGHRLKSCTTKAYQDLMLIKPKWRLLLTGTPLQNNLQELVSLLMFIHKDTFNDAEPYLRAIFKSQGHASLLSQQRTSRARTMLTPFVLRRRKAHVLTLPPKIETVEHCEMTPVQAKLYRETMRRSKKVFEEYDDAALEEAAAVDDIEGNSGKAKPKAKKGKKAAEPKSAASSSSHILMDLRKAASHPLLFRKHYTDAKIRMLAKECLNTPQWCDSNFDYVVEDFSVMSDAEISHFCAESDYDELRKHALDPKAYIDGGKVKALQKHIERCKKEGKRMLLFSQFVMILDILEVALTHLDVEYTRLDGQTRTDERQGIVDEFTENPDITVFLLSTKAGGVGINLVAASVVVIYDQDFNPHNDRQAADRAYRIGQEKEVEVIKLITKDSIDEDMLAIGVTKLQLDDAVGGEEITLDGEAGGAAQKDDKTAKEVRKSLLTTLRNKFEAAPSSDAITDITEEDEETAKEEEDLQAATPVKKKIARGQPASQSQTLVDDKEENEATPVGRRRR